MFNSTISLHELTLSVLLLSFLFRFVLLMIAMTQYAIICGGKLKEGLELFNALDIPGFKEFFRSECITGFLPYASLYVLVVMTDLSDIIISEMEIYIVLITIFVLLIWVFLDWIRSIKLYTELYNIIKEVKILSKVAGTALDGLKYVVHIRGGIVKSIFRIGFSRWRTKKIEQLKEKVDKHEAETKKKSLFRTATLFASKVLSFPEKVISSITDWAKDSIDEKLNARFEKYLSKSKSKSVFNYLWALFPTIWLILILQLV